VACYHSTVPGTIVPMTVGVAIQADTNYEKVNNALYVIPLGMYVVRHPHDIRPPLRACRS
jgi:hypothetical protein